MALFHFSSSLLFLIETSDRYTLWLSVIVWSFETKYFHYRTHFRAYVFVKLCWLWYFSRHVFRLSYCCLKICYEVFSFFRAFFSRFFLTRRFVLVDLFFWFPQLYIVSGGGDKSSSIIFLHSLLLFGFCDFFFVFEKMRMKKVLSLKTTKCNLHFYIRKSILVCGITFLSRM